MLTLNIPDNINDIYDIKGFVEAIKEINSFNKKIDLFANKILSDKYLKKGKDIVKFLSKEDLTIYVTNFLKPKIFSKNLTKKEKEKELNIKVKKMIKSLNLNHEEFYKNKSNKINDLFPGGEELFLLDFNNQSLLNWYTPTRTTKMGSCSGNNITYSFSYNGEVLQIAKEWETQSCRMTHIPWIRHKETMSINIINDKIIYWE
jgi:hypothetical protein